MIRHLTAAALAVATLSACTTLPPGFAPKAPGWPVGTGPRDITPGIYSPGTTASPRAAKACRWDIGRDAGTIGRGSRETVALLPGDRLIATDCGGWHRVATWPEVTR